MDSARRTASIHAPRVPSAHAVASGALISQPLSPDALPRISGRSLRSLVALCSSALTALVAMSRHHGLCSRLRGRLSPRRRRVYATLRRRRARCSVVASIIICSVKSATRITLRVVTPRVCRGYRHAPTLRFAQGSDRQIPITASLPKVGRQKGNDEYEVRNHLSER